MTLLPWMFLYAVCGSMAFVSLMMASAVKQPAPRLDRLGVAFGTALVTAPVSAIGTSLAIAIITNFQENQDQAFMWATLAALPIITGWLYRWPPKHKNDPKVKVRA